MRPFFQRFAITDSPSSEGNVPDMAVMVPILLRCIRPGAPRRPSRAAAYLQLDPLLTRLYDPPPRG